MKQLNKYSLTSVKDPSVSGQCCPPDISGGAEEDVRVGERLDPCSGGHSATWSGSGT